MSSDSASLERSSASSNCYFSDALDASIANVQKMMHSVYNFGMQDDYNSTQLVATMNNLTSQLKLLTETKKSSPDSFYIPTELIK